MSSYLTAMKADNQKIITSKKDGFKADSEF